MDEKGSVCKICGHKTNFKYSYCVNCGTPLPSKNTGNFFSKFKKTLLRKDAKRPITRKTRIVILMSVLITQIFLFSIFFLTLESSTTVDPEAIDWIPLEVINPAFENIPWANIVEANYAIEREDLYFCVKWNGMLPASIISNDLIAPRYLVYRKAYISWTINEGYNSIVSKGILFVGSKDVILFEFIEGAVNFRYTTKSIPFQNETTAAFKISYQKGTIPKESLTEISITPASEYIAYHQFQSELHSLSDLPESSSNDIIIDGNLSDWSSSSVKSLQMDGDPIISKNINITAELVLPTFDNILVTRTGAGVYGAVSFSNNNFTKFIESLGNLNININWHIVLAEVDGSFAADFTFETSLYYNYTTGYYIQNVSMGLLAGTSYPSISESWQLLQNQSGTYTAFECIFPNAIISDLYDWADDIHFYSGMIIECF